jgi:methylthioribulose-1-phosphate dehydratase
MGGLERCRSCGVFRYTLRMNFPSYRSHLPDAARSIVTAANELARSGWTPATSSNFSMRLDDKHAAITVSGRDKGRMTDDDVMVVDFDGNPVDTSHRPSAETLLHTQLYKRFAEIGCVLHTHSLNQTLASRLFAGAGHVRFEDYELIKAFRGNDTHETMLDLPVLPNNQHIPTLAAQVDALLDSGSLWGYLIEGHGLYAWGADMAEARRHLEAFEFLISCELEMRKLRMSP